MTLTAIGYLLVPLGLALVVLGRTRGLLHAMIFFSAFSASSIFTVGGSRFGMQPSFFFGALFIYAVWMRAGVRRIDLAPVQLTFLVLIGAFWLYCAASLLFPLIQESLGLAPQLLNPGIIEWQPRSRGFQSYSATQFVYLTFFLLIAICIMIEVQRFADITKTVRTLIVSAIVTTLWGLGLQYSSFFTGYDYPEWLFNNHPGYSHGLEENVLILPRLTSVAPEPSMFAYFLMMVVPVLLTLRLAREDVYGFCLQQFALLLLVLAAIIGASTAAYFGLALMIAIIPVTVIYARYGARVAATTGVLIQVKYLLYTVLFVAALYMAAWIALPRSGDIDLLTVLANLTIFKLEGGSGDARFAAFQRGLEILLETGFVGAGWGSNSTFDLISTLLSNVGLAGFALFLMMVGMPLYRAWIGYGSVREKPGASLVLGLALSLTIGLLIMFAAIPGFIFTFFWIIFGLLLAVPRVTASGMASSVTQSQR